MKQRNKKITERRKRRVLSGIIAVVLVAAMGLGMFLNFETKVQAAPNTVVDPDTTNVWTNYTRPGGQPSTQNVGRIWTDKSVFDDTYTFTSDNDAGLSSETIEKGGSDFLVSLSALSSTSNLKEMVQTGKPLDIVLVLDDSGSMDYLMAVYDDGSLDKNQTYHTEDGSDLWGSTGNEVTWNEDQQEWGYYSWSWGGQQWNRVTPKTSSDDIVKIS